jgi:hypothetical protein
VVLNYEILAVQSYVLHAAAGAEGEADRELCLSGESGAVGAEGCCDAVAHQQRERAERRAATKEIRLAAEEKVVGRERKLIEKKANTFFLRRIFR